jgi:hypothetical protein
LTVEIGGWQLEASSFHPGSYQPKLTEHEFGMRWSPPSKDMSLKVDRASASPLWLMDMKVMNKKLNFLLKRRIKNETSQVYVKKRT